jgi:hypothetical protein
MRLNMSVPFSPDSKAHPLQEAFRICFKFYRMPDFANVMAMETPCSPHPLKETSKAVQSSKRGHRRRQP